MTTPHQVSPGVRSVLTAPRGHRFSRPGSARPLALPSEPDPRHTPLIELWGPHASHPPAAAPPQSHQDRRERLLRQMEGNPRLSYRLQHNAVPHWKDTHQRQEQTRQTRKPVKPPATARGRHRAPRRWWAWPAVAISTTLLMAQSIAESGPFPRARGAVPVLG
jgi:hypothetical protein